MNFFQWLLLYTLQIDSSKENIQTKQDDSNNMRTVVPHVAKAKIFLELWITGSSSFYVWEKQILIGVRNPQPWRNSHKNRPQAKALSMPSEVFNLKWAPLITPLNLGQLSCSVCRLVAQLLISCIIIPSVLEYNSSIIRIVCKASLKILDQLLFRCIPSTMHNCDSQDVSRELSITSFVSKSPSWSSFSTEKPTLRNPPLTNLEMHGID